MLGWRLERSSSTFDVLLDNSSRSNAAKVTACCHTSGKWSMAVLRCFALGREQEGAAMAAAAAACKCGEVAMVTTKRLGDGAPCLPSSVMVLPARVGSCREAPDPCLGGILLLDAASCIRIIMCDGLLRLFPLEDSFALDRVDLP